MIQELLPKLEKAFETVVDSSGLIAPVRVGSYLYRSPKLAILVISDAPELCPAADDLQRHACCKTVLEGLEHDHIPPVGDFAGRKPPQRCGQTCPRKISYRGVAHGGNLLPEFAPVPHREKRPGLMVPYFHTEGGKSLLTLPYRNPEDDFSDIDVGAMLSAVRMRLSEPLRGRA